MPWIWKGKKRVFVHPPRPDRSLLDGPRPRVLDPAYCAAWQRQHEAQRHYMRRLFVDWLELHLQCPRHACRRGGSCQSPTVECYGNERDFIRKHFGPDFMKAVRARYDELRGSDASGK